MHLENEHFIDHIGENLGRFASILHEYPQTCAVVNIASVPLRLHSQSSANASQHYLTLIHRIAVGFEHQQYRYTVQYMDAWT